jgi:hypothetical protein
MIFGGIIFAILLYESYKNNILVFSPYVRSVPSDNTFYPLGTITPLSSDQLQKNAKILEFLQDDGIIDSLDNE